MGDGNGNILADLVAARSYAGTDPGDDRTLIAQAIESSPENALDQPSPARVDGSNMSGSGEQDGNTVSRDHAQGQPLLRREESIPLATVTVGCCVDHRVRMDLVKEGYPLGSAWNETRQGV